MNDLNISFACATPPGRLSSSYSSSGQSAYDLESFFFARLFLPSSSDFFDDFFDPLVSLFPPFCFVEVEDVNLLPSLTIFGPSLPSSYKIGSSRKSTAKPNQIPAITDVMGAQIRTSRDIFPEKCIATRP